MAFFALYLFERKKINNIVFCQIFLILFYFANGSYRKTTNWEYDRMFIIPFFFFFSICYLLASKYFFLFCFIFLTILNFVFIFIINFIIIFIIIFIPILIGIFVLILFSLSSELLFLTFIFWRFVFGSSCAVQICPPPWATRWSSWRQIWEKNCLWWVSNILYCTLLYSAVPYSTLLYPT